MAGLRSLKSELRQELADVWRDEAGSVDAARLSQIDRGGLVKMRRRQPVTLWPWYRITTMEAAESDGGHNRCGYPHGRSSRPIIRRNPPHEPNSTRLDFSTLADFREGDFDWLDGHRNGSAGRVRASRETFAMAHEGDAAIHSVLPAGDFHIRVIGQIERFAPLANSDTHARQGQF